MVYPQAVTKGLSKAITKKKVQGLSNRKSRTFIIGLSKESPRLSKRKSLRFLRIVLKVITKGFQGD